MRERMSASRSAVAAFLVLLYVCTVLASCTLAAHSGTENARVVGLRLHQVEELECDNDTEIISEDESECLCRPGLLRDWTGICVEQCPRGHENNEAGQTCDRCESLFFVNREETQSFCDNCPSGTHVVGNFCEDCEVSTSTFAVLLVLIVATLMYCLIFLHSSLLDDIIEIWFAVQLVVASGQLIPNGASNTYRIFMQYCSVFLFDVKFLAPGCGAKSVGDSFTETFYVNMLIILIINVPIYWILFVLIRRAKSPSESRFYMRRTIRTGRIMFVLCFFTLVNRSMQGVQCGTMPDFDGTFLAVDQHIVCYESDHMPILIFSSVILVTAFSAILWTMYRLFVDRHRLYKERDLRERYGFMLSFVDKYFWCGFLPLLELLGVLMGKNTAKTLMDQERSQFYAIFPVSMIVFSVFAALKPYLYRWENRLFLWVIGFMSLISLYTFLNHEFALDEVDILVSLLSTLTMLFFSALIIFMTVVVIRRHRTAKDRPWLVRPLWRQYDPDEDDDDVKMTKGVMGSARERFFEKLAHFAAAESGDNESGGEKKKKLTPAALFLAAAAKLGTSANALLASDAGSDDDDDSDNPHAVAIGGDDDENLFIPLYSEHFHATLTSPQLASIVMPADGQHRKSPLQRFHTALVQWLVERHGRAPYEDACDFWAEWTAAISSLAASHHSSSSSSPEQFDWRRGGSLWLAAAPMHRPQEARLRELIRSAVVQSHELQMAQSQTQSLRSSAPTPQHHPHSVPQTPTTPPRPPASATPTPAATPRPPSTATAAAIDGTATSRGGILPLVAGESADAADYSDDEDDRDVRVDVDDGDTASRTTQRTTATAITTTARGDGGDGAGTDEKDANESSLLPSFNGCTEEYVSEPALEASDSVFRMNVPPVPTGTFTAAMWGFVDQCPKKAFHEHIRVKTMLGPLLRLQGAVGAAANDVFETEGAKKFVARYMFFCCHQWYVEWKKLFELRHQRAPQYDDLDSDPFARNVLWAARMLRSIAAETDARHRPLAAKYAFAARFGAAVQAMVNANKRPAADTHTAP